MVLMRCTRELIETQQSRTFDVRDDSGLSVLYGAYTLIYSLGIKLMGEKRNSPHHPFPDLPINLPHPITVY